MPPTLTVEQAIKFLEGCLPAGDSMKVTSLVVSCEVGADDMPVEEPDMKNIQDKSNGRG